MMGCGSERKMGASSEFSSLGPSTYLSTVHGSKHTRFGQPASRIRDLPTLTRFVTQPAYANSCITVRGDHVWVLSHKSSSPFDRERCDNRSPEIHQGTPRNSS